MPVRWNCSTVEKFKLLHLYAKNQFDPTGETIIRSVPEMKKIRIHYVNNECIVYNREIAGSLSKPAIVLFRLRRKCKY